MHYYKFNIGDYASHTKSLSPIEDIAYRRLMDEYYLHEQPLIGCSTDVARSIGMRDYADDVAYILNRFFQSDGDVWRHKRIDREIEQYHNQIEAKSRAGKASARARQAKASGHPNNTSSTDDEHPLNSVEQTNNQEPVTKNQSKIPVNEIVDLFNISFPELPQVQKVTPARSRAVKARWAEHKTMQDIERWKAFFGYIRQSDFLMGRSGNGWAGLTFDWITKSSNFLKIIEGNYHNVN